MALWELLIVNGYDSHEYNAMRERSPSVATAFLPAGSDLNDEDRIG
jgi:hypothetical protein